MEDNNTAGNTKAVYAGVLLIALLVRLPALWIPWHFDDFHHIAGNRAVMSLANVPRFFTDPTLFSSRAGGEGMYRPLLMTTHAVTYAVFGSKSWGAHLVSVFLHLINTALVLSLLRRWTGDIKAAALGALFWSLAGIQHEALGYACARSTLLASFFMLSALRVTQGGRSPWRSGALAAFFFALALFSKEIAFVLPLLILLRDLTLSRGKGMSIWPRWPVYAMTGAIMPLYLAARFLIFTEPMGTVYMPRHVYLLTQARVFFYYLAKTAFPVNLTLLPEMPIAERMLAPPVMAPVSAVILVLVFGALLYRKAPFVGFGIFWFALCLAPTSSLVPLVRIANIERIYLPLIGVVVIAADLWPRVFKGAGKKAGAAAYTAAFIIVFNAALSVRYHALWFSELEVMRHAVRMAPAMNKPWLWLGIMEIEDRRYEAARKHLFKSLKIDPDDTLAEESLSRIYALTDSGISAKQTLERLVNDPLVPLDQKIEALIKLAAYDIDEDRPDTARERAKLVLENQPENADAHYILGRAAEVEGKNGEAKTHYLRALEIYPEHQNSQTQLGMIAFDEGDLVSARAYLSRVAGNRDARAEVYVTLGHVSLRENKPDEARAFFRRAIDLYPEEAVGYLNMGLYYLLGGDLDRAGRYAGLAVEKDPGSPAARSFMAEVYLRLARAAGAPAGSREVFLERAAVQIKWLKARGMGEDLEQRWESLSKKKLP
jgi:tetratricopeptide (TPR) repeat protein